LTEVQEDWALNDWDSIYKKLSWPVSLFLNGLSISLRLGYWFDGPKYDPVLNPRLTSFALWSRPNSPNAYLREIGDTNFWTSSFPGNIIYYSPAQVLILQYLDAENYQQILLAAAFVGFNVNTYEELIKDKQLIAGEIMNEYNKKLVYPHLFVRKFEI
ncbi:12563_t:CDS:2, partial [Racocetra fulgida]